MIQFADRVQFGFTPLDADGLTRTCLPLGDGEFRLTGTSAGDSGTHRDLLFAARFGKTSGAEKQTVYDTSYIQYDPTQQTTRILSEAAPPLRLGGPLPTGTDPVQTTKRSEYNSDGCTDTDYLWYTEYTDSD